MKQSISPANVDLNTCKTFVENNVLCSATSLIASMTTISKVVETTQFCNLLTGPKDFEAAARDEGWISPEEFEGEPTSQNVFSDTTDGQTWCCDDWETLCMEFDIEADNKTIFEHWVVSELLAEKLKAKGETIDNDFMGLRIWGRCATGTDIYEDDIIQEIARETSLKQPPRAVRSFLELSTAHVSNDGQSWLVRMGDKNRPDNGRMGPANVATHYHGWWMYVSSDPDHEPDNMPDDLHAVARYAAELDCDFVLFDADALAIEDLPIFEEVE